MAGRHELDVFAGDNIQLVRRIIIGRGNATIPFARQIVRYPALAAILGGGPEPAMPVPNILTPGEAKPVTALDPDRVRIARPVVPHYS